MFTGVLKCWIYWRISWLITPLPLELTGDEYNTIDRLFRNYIVISDYAMTEDGGIDHNDDKTLFDALAIRLYNGGFFLVYKYDQDWINPHGYWEYREYYESNGKRRYYVRDICTVYVNYFSGGGED